MESFRNVPRLFILLWIVALFLMVARQSTYCAMVSAVAGIVEKPRFDDVPSDTASIGRYILKQGIFDVLRDLPAGSGAEIQLADAINIQA